MRVRIKKSEKNLLLCLAHRLPVGMAKGLPWLDSLQKDCYLSPAHSQRGCMASVGTSLFAVERQRLLFRLGCLWWQMGGKPHLAVVVWEVAFRGLFSTNVAFRGLFSTNVTFRGSFQRDVAFRGLFQQDELSLQASTRASRKTWSAATRCCSRASI